MSDRCAYCKNKFDKKYRTKTREHLYPQSIIKLFPDQNISFGMHKTFKDNDGIALKDVCQICNNENLGDLDTYGSNLIKEYFLNEFRILDLEEAVSIELDINKLSRWLLKIVYNFIRYLKLDSDWFDDSLNFILSEEQIDEHKYSIFVGLHVNSSPLPEENYEYKPLQIYSEPKLIGNSLAVVSFGIDPYINSVSLKGASGTYSIRFGSFVAYIILWNSRVKESDLNYGNQLMVREFSFTKLDPIISNTKFRRISAHSNSVIGYWHLISKSGIVQDDLIIGGTIGERNPFETQDLIRSMRTKEDVEYTRAMVEATMFPDNQQVQKKLEELLARKRV